MSKDIEYSGEIALEGAGARNVLNTLDNLLATERHYRELASRANSEDNDKAKEYYRKKQDQTRYLRQSVINMLDVDKESWCCLKGLLKARHNWEETYQKAERDENISDEEMENIMGLSRELDELISDQYKKMLNTEEK